jgi:NAD(P)-dependent dehydrogenase (short-subunit alcohol dehydrogenase family)
MTARSAGLGRVEGKIALITGASQGIGAACARLLLREGARVVIGDVDIARGHALARELGVRFLHLDVANEAAWRRAVGAIAGEHGTLDVLVNNAAIRIAGPLEDTRLEDFRRVYQVNVEGVFLGLRHALPLLRAGAARRAAGSSVINLSSVLGIKGSVNNAAYATSKGAVRHLTKCSAIEFAQLGYNIRVNSVHPAATDTAMVAPTAEARAAAVQRIPLGRVATPEDVAATVLFLASDESGFTTGAEYAVDGGRLAA